MNRIIAIIVLIGAMVSGFAADKFRELNLSDSARRAAGDVKVAHPDAITIEGWTSHPDTIRTGSNVWMIGQSGLPLKWEISVRPGIGFDPAFAAAVCYEIDEEN